jgi:PPOX class probable FMN-dependent enzyme
VGALLEHCCGDDAAVLLGSPYRAAYTRGVIVEETSQRRRITDLASLRELVGTPSERAMKKQLPVLDVHARAFLERSPFVLLGTAGPDGRCDVSPKGDHPGFALVLDERTLAIPDRPGNRRLDSLQNVLGNPHVGLLFLIPGMDETLRVNGTAELVLDADLLDRLQVAGKRPLLGILVHVEEAFLHCARSFLRAKLWDPAEYMPRDQMPSLARMITDQTRPSERGTAEFEQVVAAAEETTAEAYRCLY